MNCLTKAGVGITALLATSAALAVPQGAFWVEIPVVDHPDDAVDLTGFRSFDLYVQVEDGDIITAADFGIAGFNTGLMTSQAIFNHPFGDDKEQGGVFLETFPDLAYDTFLALGDLDGANNEITVQWFETSDPSQITGAWNANAPAGALVALPGGGVFPSENALWLARFTISSAGAFGEHTGATEFLGGELFVSYEGPNGNTCGINFMVCVNTSDNAFAINESLPPSDFTMLTPACDATNVSPQLTTLSWEPSTNATHYKVRVTTDYRLWDTVHDSGLITTTSHTLPFCELDPCTTYYWMAQAFEALGNSTPATNWQLCSFTTTILGDLNTDGTVDTADLGIFITNYQTTDMESDLNCDGVVDTADLGRLIARFGLTCD